MVIKPFLDHLGKEHGFAFKTITADSYPPITGIIRSEVAETGLKFYDVAQTLVDMTLEEIVKSDVIIISSIGFERLPSMKSALDSLVESMRSDQDLIILNSFPILDRHPVRVNKVIAKKTDYEFQIVDKSKNRELLINLAAKYDNVHFYDLSKSRVFDSPPFYKDTIMYYDDRHINAFGAVAMAKDLDNDFMNLLDRLMKKNKNPIKPPVPGQSSLASNNGT